MSINELLLNMVQSSTEDLENPDIPLSTVIRKCIRIARLRNDFENLLWLELEMTPFKDETSIKKINDEILLHYTQQELKDYNDKVIQEYFSTRESREFDKQKETFVNKGKVCALSIRELEDSIKFYDNEAEKAKPPKGLLGLDLYHATQSYDKRRAMLLAMSSDLNNILRIVEHRVDEYLSKTEKQIIYGQTQSDIYERNRAYVNKKLNEICPDALTQFIAALKRSSEEDDESRSQSLLSCRRILKSLADKLYPPVDTNVKCFDGKDRILNDEKYISRLWEYVGRLVHGKKSGDLLLSQITDIGNRIDRVYELSSKGIHSNVNEFEVNQCIIQTYITIGDILRLSDSDTAIDYDLKING